jgi:hypothetical protein
MRVALLCRNRTYNTRNEPTRIGLITCGLYLQKRVSKKITVICGVAFCSLMDTNWRCRVTCRIHHRYWQNILLKRLYVNITPQGFLRWVHLKSCYRCSSLTYKARSSDAWWTTQSLDSYSDAAEVSGRLGFDAVSLGGTSRTQYSERNTSQCHLLHRGESLLNLNLLSPIADLTENIQMQYDVFSVLLPVRTVAAIHLLEPFPRLIHIFLIRFRSFFLSFLVQSLST